jgi:hypothetical protein
MSAEEEQPMGFVYNIGKRRLPEKVGVLSAAFII